MSSTLRDPALGDEHRLFLHLAIVKVLDDLGGYGKAMRYFDMANSISGRNAPFDGAALADIINRLVARFTPAFIAANSGFGLDGETPLLIVGMPRSETTLVEQIVSSHPDIAASEELFFWSNRASYEGSQRQLFAYSSPPTPTGLFHLGRTMAPVRAVAGRAPPVAFLDGFRWLAIMTVVNVNGAPARRAVVCTVLWCWMRCYNQKDGAPGRAVHPTHHMSL